ncbi:MAG: hypothetical protein M3R52_02955 [Acidobacteriota bacterium]|nr:hypothetical protein [Acidobacteriota bacterium]MDQ2938578.1 hypothetical protein [Acidobacteriota bacterium]
MKLMETLFGTKCVDCRQNIKGEKFEFGSGWICESCKSKLEEHEPTRDEERKRKKEENRRKRDAERKRVEAPHKEAKIVIEANAAAVETMCRVVDSSVAEIATMLFARQYGRSDHLNALDGLSDVGYQAISGHYIWKTLDGGLVVTKGQNSPELGAALIGPMSALRECYVGALNNKFRS